MFSVLVLNTSPTTLTLNVWKSIPIPENLSLTFIIYIPNSDIFVASTTADNVVEITRRGQCETLIGPSPVSSRCPLKSICYKNIGTIPDIVQLLESPTNSTNVFILSRQELWEIRLITCTLQSVMMFANAFAPQYMSWRLDNTAMADLITWGSVQRVNVETGEMVSVYQLPSFMSGYRVPITNVGCTKELEVPFLMPFDNLCNYAWVGSQLLVLNSIGQLTFYRTLTLDAVEIRWTEEIIFKSFIDLVSMTSDSSQIVAVSQSQNAILVLNEKEKALSRRGRSRFYSLPSCTCLFADKKFLEVDSIDTCAVRCVKNVLCKGFSYSENMACFLYYQLTFEWNSTAIGVCYILQ